MTQKELAKKSGLTQANISNIEKGFIRPTIDSLKKIADATGKNRWSRSFIDNGYRFFYNFTIKKR